MIGLFKVYSLDDGAFVIVCGKCGYHLVVTKDVQDNARKQTLLGVLAGEEVKE